MENNEEIPYAIKTLQGMDNTKQIIDLWYEIIFLRLVVATVLNGNEELKGKMTKDLYDSCRQVSQEQVKKKFPLLKIDFKETSESM